jgi:hypothetical protein
MKRLAVTLLAWCCCYASANVVVHIENDVVVFEQSLRLDNMLSKIPLPAEPHWPSAGLFRLQDPETVSLYSATREQLNRLVLENADASHFRTDVRSLYDEIATWRLGRRVDLYIDKDLARLHLRHNPMIKEGEYRLSLSSRPRQVFIFGAVQRGGSYPLIEGMSVKRYVDMAAASASADRDYVYVILPNAEVQKIGVAYWNDEQYSLAPGSQVFVPFQTDIFSSTTDMLNQSVAQLASQRILW